MSVVDMLEDVMQASVPGVVVCSTLIAPAALSQTINFTIQHSVRVSDLGVGDNAARITSVRALPDVPNEENGNNPVLEENDGTGDGKDDDSDNGQGGEHVVRILILSELFQSEPV